ncbi:energy transducer TonB [Mucilaginibacter sp. AW1-3]
MEPLQNIKLSFKCPKQLNELQPCNGDWYCDGCQKIVHDFRGMSEGQILDVFAKSDHQVCGMFEAGRIEVLPQQNNWLKWASAAMLFLGLTGLSQLLYAQIKNKSQNTFSAKADTSERPLVGAINTPDPDTVKLTQPLIKPLPEDVFFGVAIETFPEFPGGEAALNKYLAAHIKYIDGFTGKVYVQFAVEKDGSLTNIKIIRGSNNEANDQVIKAIKAMPKWKPGIQNGKPYSVQYTLPVNFSRQ